MDRFPIAEELAEAPSISTWNVVHTDRDPYQVAPQVHRTLRELDSARPFTLLTWQKDPDTSLFPARMAAISLGVLGLLGSLLAATDIFGMASYSVCKRLKEMDTRMAPGAGNCCTRARPRLQVVCHRVGDRVGAGPDRQAPARLYRLRSVSA